MHQKPLQPLRFLHARETLVRSKVVLFQSIETEVILGSLLPGSEGSLKARTNGTVLDGHHRLAVLLDRGVDIDALPREIILREDET